MSRSNGRPEPEVIINYADGFAYSKGKLEEAFRAGGILEKAPPKPVRDPAFAALKREDIDLIVHEFEISRTEAEKTLLENGGDVQNALRSLIYPSSLPPSSSTTTTVLTGAAVPAAATVSGPSSSREAL